MSRKALTLWLKWGLLALIVILRFIDIRERRELHADEVYSLMIARCNPAFYSGIAPGTYSGERLQDELMALHPLGEDLSELYTENHDVPHASLYYMLLRVALEGQEEWSPTQLALRGGLLNLVFLIVTYLMLWRLTSGLTGGNQWLCAACCAMALFAPGAGECVALVREYQLAMLAVVWYAFALWRLYSGRGLTHRQLAVRMTNLGLAAALCLSTGYLNAFLLIIMPLACLAGKACGTRGERGERRHEMLRLVWQIGVASLAGLIVARGLYAGYFHFITEGSVHKTRAFANFGGALKAAFSRDLLDEGLTVPLAIALGISLIASLVVRAWRDDGRGGREQKIFMAVMVVSAVVSVVAVQYCSLLRQARYSYPYLPLLCGLLPLCVSGLKARWREGVAVGVLVYMCAMGVMKGPRRDYGWGRQQMLLSKGAVLHGLNPNELPLVYPVLTPGAVYTVEGKDARFTPGEGVSVTHFQPKGLPADKKVERGTGPIRIIYSGGTRENEVFSTGLYGAQKQL